MTLQEAKSIARHLGLTLRKVRSGDYRVDFRDGNETTAYYTGSLEDAVNTAVELARTRALRPVPCDVSMKWKDHEKASKFYCLAVHAHRDRHRDRTQPRSGAGRGEIWHATHVSRVRAASCPYQRASIGRSREGFLGSRWLVSACVGVPQAASQAERGL